MTVGDGLFAASIVLALVALFIATKDRWMWKVIALWLVALLIAFGLLGGLAVWGWKTYEDRPTVQTTYEGVALGISIQDVRFLKGSPKDEDPTKDG